MHKVIEEAIATLEKQKEQILSYQKSVEVCQEACDKFKDVFTETAYGCGEAIRVSVGYSFGSLQGALIHIDTRKLDALIPVKAFFAEKGYGITKHDDYAEIGRRSYYLKHDDGDEIVLSAFIFHKQKGDCKFEQVGVEEKPIYELKCT